MNTIKIQGLLGLARRSGQCVFGEEGCVAQIRGGQAALVLVDAELSANGMKRYVNACSAVGLTPVQLPGGLISSATGKAGCMAVVLKAGGLSAKMMTLLTE